MNPGPVTLSERVRNALLRPDLCHREPEFSELQQRIRNNLLQVYDLEHSDWATILLTGSGTSAVEAMISSLVPVNGHVLVIENGVYGERISRIADIYRIQYTRMHHDWGAEINLDEFRSLLDKNNFTHVLLVHHETTTGRLNDLPAVADICNRLNIPLMVDGVSSYGAEELDFGKWNIAACAATANKCLHGVPAISFVVCRRSALAEVDGMPARNLYLNLANYLKQQDAGSTPFTQSVQGFYALDEAIDEFMDNGGWRERQKLYRERMQIVRTGMENYSIVPLLDDNVSSCVLNSFFLPANTDYPALHDHLKENGFVIYAGQGELAKKIFRVSVMGEITMDDLRRFVTVIGKNIT